MVYVSATSYPRGLIYVPHHISKLGACALLVVVALLSSCGGTSLEALAGDDSTISVGESLTLDGCDSTGDINQYEWVIQEAPSNRADAIGMTLSAGEGCTFEVDPMDTSDAGSWAIELTVTNSDGDTSSDQVVVTVS